MSVHDAVADSVKDFGGYLECERCRRIQELGDTAHYLKHGWPKCCGLTMRWWTARQLAERDVNDKRRSPTRATE